ncbi:hypothetical protein ZK44_01010 [Salmonella enterica subsp. enterica serovar Corvallis]|nr:hypothetical protein [Salmonella enterica subsp. enterica serovar Corvallis]
MSAVGFISFVALKICSASFKVCSNLTSLNVSNGSANSTIRS